MYSADIIGENFSLNIPYEESYIKTPYKVWKISFILFLVFGIAAGATILYAYSELYRPSDSYDFNSSAWNEYYDTMVMLEMISLGLALIAIIPAIMFVIFNFILLYRNWRVIQHVNGNKTTPGTAVGLLFIPIFTYYWQFVAHVQLSTHQQNAFDQAGITPYKRPNKAIALAYCVITCLMAAINMIPEEEAKLFALVFIAPISILILGPIKETHQKNVSLELIRRSNIGA